MDEGYRHQPDQCFGLGTFFSSGYLFLKSSIFFNNSDLKKSPKVAMCFHWKSLRRQIRILGNASQVTDKEADLYFESRPYGRKIGAWASEQSNIMKERSELLKKNRRF